MAPGACQFDDLSELGRAAPVGEGQLRLPRQTAKAEVERAASQSDHGEMAFHGDYLSAESESVVGPDHVEYELGPACSGEIAYALGRVTGKEGVVGPDFAGEIEFLL